MVGVRLVFRPLTFNWERLDLTPAPLWHLPPVPANADLVWQQVVTHVIEFVPPHRKPGWHFWLPAFARLSHGHLKHLDGEPGGKVLCLSLSVLLTMYLFTSLILKLKHNNVHTHPEVNVYMKLGHGQPPGFWLGLFQIKAQNWMGREPTAHTQKLYIFSLPKLDIGLITEAKV